MDKTKDISIDNLDDTAIMETENIETEEETHDRQSLTKKQIATIVILIIIAFVSFFGFATFASDEGNFTGTYQVLDEKQNIVLGMTAATAGAATAITLIPGDVGTPVADELADLSGYFIFILCAIIAEKWLITTFGFLAFRIVIPIALILVIIGIVIANEGLRKIGKKLIIFALILFFIVPFSTAITKQMDESYQAKAKQTITEINKDTENINARAEDENILERFLSTVKNGAAGIANKFKEKVTQFAEYTAHMIVTACVIPIAVILVLIWIIKMMTGINISLPKPKGSKVLHKFKK